MRSDRSTHCTRLLLESRCAANHSIPSLPRVVPYASTNNHAVTISTISVDRGLPVLDPTKLPPETSISHRSRSLSHRNAPNTRGRRPHRKRSLRPCSDGTFRNSAMRKSHLTYASVPRSNDHEPLGVRARARPDPPSAHMTRDKRDRKAKHVTTNIGSRVLLHAHLHLAKTDPASRPFDVTRTSSHHKTPTKMTDFVIHFHHSSSQSMSNSSYLSFSIFDPAEYSTSCRTMHAATGDHSFTAAWGKQNLQKTPV